MTSSCSISRALGVSSSLIRLPSNRNLREETGTPTCGQLFKQNGDLNRHVDAVHLGKRPFICGDCGATFARVQELKRHITSKHSAVAPRFACTHPGCSSSFATTR